MMSQFLFIFLAIVASCFVTEMVAVSVPACQKSAAPNQTSLNNVRTAQSKVPASPFGILYGKQKNIAFVSLDSTLGVLNTSSFAPALIQQVALPSVSLASAQGSGAADIALTNDGRHILVSYGSGATIINTDKAIAGSSNAVIGTLNGTVGVGAIGVLVSPDDQYAFVLQEYGNNQTSNRGNIEVFKLSAAANNSSVSGTYIGYAALGNAVAGAALSVDGTKLYATSELANSTATQGTLSILDVTTLVTNPGQAVTATIPAGCGPVRVAVSPDGQTVWVTARESNQLLAFDAAKLSSTPGSALLASLEVGTSPVGLVFVKNGSRILTADSNRFHYTGATTGLSVVNVSAALSGQSAVIGRIATGLFPREFALSANGSTILIAEYDSDMIQALDVDTLP